MYWCRSLANTKHNSYDVDNSDCLFLKEEQRIGEELEDELNTKGPGKAIFIPCDVTQEEDIKVRPSLLKPEADKALLVWSKQL